MKNKLPAGACLAACIIMTGCAADTASSAVPASTASASVSIPASNSASQVPPEVTGESSVELVRKMMELDREALSVEEFDAAIVQICTDAGAEYFSVIADAVELAGTLDAETYTYLNTTLEYASQTIFGETAFWADSWYLTGDGKSAADMVAQRRELAPTGWDALLDSMITGGRIETMAFYRYLVQYNIPDPTAITAAQRDERLNAVTRDMEDYVSTLPPETMAADADIAPLNTHLQTLAEENSDELITITCTDQAIENTDAM